MPFESIRCWQQSSSNFIPYRNNLESREVIHYRKSFSTWSSLIYARWSVYVCLEDLETVIIGKGQFMCIERWGRTSMPNGVILCTVLRHLSTEQAIFTLPRLYKIFAFYDAVQISILRFWCDDLTRLQEVVVE